MEYQRRYRKENPEAVRKCNAKLRKENVERYREYHLKWNEENAAKMREYKEKYRKEHPEVFRRKEHRRRARKRSVLSDDWMEVEIFERDKWICQICGKSVDKDLKWPDPQMASIDHVITLSKEGPDTRDNVRLAHLGCNIQKGNKE